MLACMITSTVNLIPWVIPKVSGHCDNLLGVTTSVNLTKLQRSEIYQPARNCKASCDGGYVACDVDHNPLWGSCWSDCDCSICFPFCSTLSTESFGFCQERPG